jgi:transcriptional regulator with XRE-family HTH domain
MITGQTLRKLRLLKEVKQTTLAKKLGISQQAYSKLEKSSHIDAQKLVVLLDLLQCSREELKVFLPPPPAS